MNKECIYRSMCCTLVLLGAKKVMESRSYKAKYWSFFLSIVSFFMKIRLNQVSLFSTL